VAWRRLSRQQQLCLTRLPLRRSSMSLRQRPHCLCWRRKSPMTLLTFLKRLSPRAKNTNEWTSSSRMRAISRPPPRRSARLPLNSDTSHTYKIASHPPLLLFVTESSCVTWLFLPSTGPWRSPGRLLSFQNRLCASQMKL